MVVSHGPTTSHLVGMDLHTLDIHGDMPGARDARVHLERAVATGNQGAISRPLFFAPALHLRFREETIGHQETSIRILLFSFVTLLNLRAVSL